MSDGVVDSSCLINLCATAEVRSILSTMDVRLHVPPAVDCESNYLRRRRPDAEEFEPIDLDSLTSDDLLRLWSSDFSPASSLLQPAN